MVLILMLLDVEIRGEVTRKRLYGGRHAIPIQSVCHLQYCKSSGNHASGIATAPQDRGRVVYQNGGDLHWWRCAHGSSSKSLVEPVCLFSEALWRLRHQTQLSRSRSRSSSSNAQRFPGFSRRSIAKYLSSMSSIYSRIASLA